MGQFMSKSTLNRHGTKTCPKLEESGLFLVIPPEIRIKIFNMLEPQDQLVLRKVCKQLALEIDNFVGPSNCTLNNFVGKKAIKFFSKCYVQSMKIEDQFTTTDFHSVISHPLGLKFFSCTKEALLNPNFVTDVLLNCKNLRNLHLGGIIKGLLCPYGPDIVLPRLTKLKLNSNNMKFVYLLDSRVAAFINALQGRPFDICSAMTFWNNQLTILSKLFCPVLQEANLCLYSCENTQMDNADEIELAAVFTRFLSRHQDLNKILVYHSHRPVEHRLQEFQQPLTFFNRSFRSLRHYTRETREDLPLRHYHPQEQLRLLPRLLQTLSFSRLKEFEFCSKIGAQYGIESSENFESHVLTFLKSLKGLETIKFNGTKGRSLPWSEVEVLLTNNSTTLQHLEIVAKIDNVVSFKVLAKCTCLKIIRLNNKQKYRHASLSPLIEHFGVYNNLVDNLETLLLQNIGLKASDFRSLYRLRKLKHLGLYRWRCGLGEENISLEGIQTVLAIPTLEALLIPWPRTFMADLDAIVLELDQHCRRNYFKLKTYLHPTDARRMGVVQYLTIDQGNSTQPLWVKTDWGFRILNTFNHN